MLRLAAFVSALVLFAVTSSAAIPMPDTPRSISPETAKSEEIKNIPEAIKSELQAATQYRAVEYTFTKHGKTATILREVYFRTSTGKILIAYLGTGESGMDCLFVVVAHLGQYNSEVRDEIVFNKNNSSITTPYKYLLSGIAYDQDGTFRGLRFVIKNEKGEIEMEETYEWP